MERSFFKGALVGGLSGALVMLASSALAGSGIGGVFNLGVKNSVNATSALIGKTTGAMLRVRNNGTGPAAAFQVAAGKAPFGVNSKVKVANLNADLLDGIDSTGFYAAGSKVADSAHADNADHATNADHASNADHATNADDLGGVPASAYCLAATCVAGPGALAALYRVPSAGSSFTVNDPATNLFSIEYDCPVNPNANDGKMILTSLPGSSTAQAWVDAGGGNPLYFLFGPGAKINLTPSHGGDGFTVQIQTTDGMVLTLEITTVHQSTVCQVVAAEMVSHWG